MSKKVLIAGIGGGKIKKLVLTELLIIKLKIKFMNKKDMLWHTLILMNQL